MNYNNKTLTNHFTAIRVLFYITGLLFLLTWVFILIIKYKTNGG